MTWSEGIVVTQNMDSFDQIHNFECRLGGSWSPYSNRHFAPLLLGHFVSMWSTSHE